MLIASCGTGGSKKQSVKSDATDGKNLSGKVDHC